MHDFYLFYVGLMTGIGATLAFFIVYTRIEHETYMKIIRNLRKRVNVLSVCSFVVKQKRPL